jgi:ABC-2 type transport system permease protein
MGKVLLIARREFLLYVRTRGFILTLLLVPGWIFLGGLLHDLITHAQPTRYFGLVDETGEFIRPVDQALAATAQQASRAALADWARNYVDLAALSRDDPEAAAIVRGEGADAVLLQRFAVRGGSAGLLPALERHRHAAAPAFVDPDARLVRVDLPPAVMAAARVRDHTRLRALLGGAERLPVANGTVALFALAVVPASFSGDAPRIEYWSENQLDTTLPDFLRHTLLDALRHAAASAAGMDAKTLRAMVDTTVDIDRFNPANVTTRGAVTGEDTLRLLFPCAIALLTLLAILSIGSMLLMAVVEEKSSRVVEMLLAAVSPQRLMAGKLIGATGAALLMMAGSLLGAFGAVTVASTVPAWFVPIALARAHVVDDLPLMALCFACGLVTYTTIFLGVGAMARTFQEAQSYLGPLMFLLIAPVGFTLVLIKEPNGILATALSFSPLHAPFFLMIRLPHHPPVAITVAAFAWMIVCTAGFARLMVVGFLRNVLPAEHETPLHRRLKWAVNRAIRRGGPVSVAR